MPSANLIDLCVFAPIKYGVPVYVRIGSKMADLSTHEQRDKKVVLARVLAVRK